MNATAVIYRVAPHLAGEGAGVIGTKRCPPPPKKKGLRGNESHSRLKKREWKKKRIRYTGC